MLTALALNQRAPDLSSRNGSGAFRHTGAGERPRQLPSLNRQPVGEARLPPPPIASTVPLTKPLFMAQQ
jgi:hypothetical protein